MEELEFPITKKEAERRGIPYSAEKNREAAFPKRIRDLRNQRGVSQAVLAKTLNVSKSTIGLYEAGETLPDAQTLRALAEYFGVSGDYLLGLSNVQTRDPDISTACNITGLSELTIRRLNVLRDSVTSDGLSALINDPKFIMFCGEIGHFTEIVAAAKEYEETTPYTLEYIKPNDIERARRGIFMIGYDVCEYQRKSLTQELGEIIDSVSGLKELRDYVEKKRSDGYNDAIDMLIDGLSEEN